MYLVDRVRYGIPLHDPPIPQASSGSKVAHCFDENTGEYVAQAIYRNLLDQKKYYQNKTYLTTVPQDRTTIFNTSSTLAPCDQKSAYYQSALWLYVSARLLAGVGLMDSAEATATLAKEYTKEGNRLTTGRKGETDEEVASIASTASTQLESICDQTTQRIEGIKTCALLLQYPFGKLSSSASGSLVKDRVKDTEASRPEAGGRKTMKDLECLFRLIGAGVFLPTKAQGCYSSTTIWAVRAGFIGIGTLYAVNTLTPLIQLMREEGKRKEAKRKRGTKA